MMSTAAPCTDGVAFIGCDAVMTSTGLPPMMFLVQSSAMPTAVPTISTASDGNWSSLSVTGRDGITPVADVQYGLVGLFATLSVLGTIILSTIVGNVFVVAAVVLERNLRNVANYLVASLAVADLMVAALVMPLAAVNEVSTRWFLGKELCDAWTSIDVLCCTASILHLVAISLDRYWAVTRLDYIHNRSARRILVMIGASWGVSVIISFPPLFFTSHRHYDPNDTGECLISQDLGYTVFSTVGAFYLPCAAMMVIYLKVFRAARARIHKKQFRSCCPDDASRFNAVATLEVCATDFDEHSAAATPSESFHQKMAKASMARERINHGAATDDDDAESSSASHTTPTFCASATAPGITVSNGQSPTAIVTLTVFSCDDDELEADNNSSPLTPPPEQDSVGDSTATCSSVGMPVASCRRPDRLSLGPRPNDRNGISSTGSVTPSNCRLPSSFSATVISGSGLSSAALSPPGSPATGNHLLAPRRTSRACSLRGSWLDLTKQFILDRRKDSPPKSKEQRAKERLEQKRERKAARTLAIITGSFISCWLPFFILAILRPFCAEACYTPPLLMSFINWLGYFNSLLNPIIYTIFNPDFRSAFRKILFGKYRRPRARQRPGASAATTVCQLD